MTTPPAAPPKVSETPHPGVPRLIRPGADGITRLATGFTKFPPAGSLRPGAGEGEAGRMEWANLPHDFAEPLELVIVAISITAMLGILVLFGQWWQK